MLAGKEMTDIGVNHLKQKPFKWVDIKAERVREIHKNVNMESILKPICAFDPRQITTH